MSAYLDNVLNQHAVHLLENCSIQDLGAFAAYLDFNLVNWLRTQRYSIARVNDFPLALMRLHAQFKWPYPLVSQSIVEQLTKQIEGIKISPSTASLESLRTLSTANSNASLSTEDQQGSTSVVSTDSNLVSVDNKEDKEELSPIFRQFTLSALPVENISNSYSDWEGFEKICGEIAVRGTQENELELKYMLDIMYESSCASWTLLPYCYLVFLHHNARCIEFGKTDDIADSAHKESNRGKDFIEILNENFIIVSDKHFSQKFLHSCGPDIVNELHKGLEQLQNWASISCFGYRALIDVYRRHLLMIGERSGEHMIIKPLSAVPVYCKNSLLSINSSHIQMNGISVLGGEILAVTNQMSPTLECYSTPDDCCTEQNGIIRKNNFIPNQQLPTAAAMNLIKKTFTPPRENGEVGDGYINIDNCSVVSNAAVVGHEQCNLM
ncbi:hypothetical protein DINM_004842 [Dirofilaria immitis]|nr:hypothetical protein [Dirofilaria immitis]